MSLEIGASFNEDDAFRSGDQLSFKGTLFHNTNDVLISRTQGTDPAADPAYTNEGRGRIAGLDLEGASKSERSFESLALTILEGKNISDPTDKNPGLESRIPTDSLRPTLGHRLP